MKKKYLTLHLRANRYRYAFAIIGIALVCLLIESPHILDAFQGNVPILFYGRVLDESDRGVPGAEVTMHVIATDRLALPIPFADNQTGWMINATTDSSGRFTVHGGRGISIEIKDVKKAGYGTPTLTKSGGNFVYTSQFAGVAPYRPNPQQPAIFRLPHLKG